MIVRKTSEEIKNHKFSEEGDSRSLREIAERQAAGDDSQINYDDIPPSD